MENYNFNKRKNKSNINLFVTNLGRLLIPDTGKTHPGGHIWPVRLFNPGPPSFQKLYYSKQAIKQPMLLIPMSMFHPFFQCLKINFQKRFKKKEKKTVKPPISQNANPWLVLEKCCNLKKKTVRHFKDLRISTQLCNL